MARHDDLDALLSRDAFRERALALFDGLCCACREAPAAEAHHIFDRKLFADGGYRLRNAAPVCGPCHVLAETCAIGVAEISAMAGVRPPLPPAAAGFGIADPADFGRLDKWGNLIRPDGSRAPGPLFADDGCRKALAQGGLLGFFYNPAA